MPTKRRGAKPLSKKLRASDERLREQLRNADMKTFDRALGKAITAPRAK